MVLGLDTSVTLRLLVGEPAAQATAVWSALAQATEPVTISDLVMMGRISPSDTTTA